MRISVKLGDLARCRVAWLVVSSCRCPVKRPPFRRSIRPSFRGFSEQGFGIGRIAAGHLSRGWSVSAGTHYSRHLTLPVSRPGSLAVLTGCCGVLWSRRRQGLRRSVRRVVDDRAAMGRLRESRLDPHEPGRDACSLSLCGSKRTCGPRVPPHREPRWSILRARPWWNGLRVFYWKRSLRGRRKFWCCRGLWRPRCWMWGQSKGRIRSRRAGCSDREISLRV